MGECYFHRWGSVACGCIPARWRWPALNNMGVRGKSGEGEWLDQPVVGLLRPRKVGSKRSIPVVGIMLPGYEVGPVASSAFVDVDDIDTSCLRSSMTSGF